MQEFAPGTLGHVAATLGLGWTALCRITGTRHSTVYRWALNNHAGRPTLVRGDHDGVRRLIDHLNKLERNAGRPGNYTMASFNFVWRAADTAALEAATSVVGRRLAEINEALSACGSEREQYSVLANFGRESRSEACRAAWDIAWRRFCRTTYPYNAQAYRTPPRGVDWYIP